MNNANTAFVLESTHRGTLDDKLASARSIADSPDAPDEAVEKAKAEVERLELVREELGKSRKSERFRVAVGNAVEVGRVIPSILRAELEDEGFAVVDDKTAVAEYGFASLGVLKRALVVDDKKTIVAMGAASTPDEALLAAVLGWCREHVLPGLEPTLGIAVAPKVAPLPDVS